MHGSVAFPHKPPSHANLKAGSARLKPFAIRKMAMSTTMQRTALWYPAKL